MARLKRLIGKASDAMRAATRLVIESKKTREKRRKLDHELEHRTKRLDARIEELEAIALDRPEHELEITLKIEEARAERGDIHDRRRRLRRVVFPNLRDRIATGYRRRAAQRHRREKLRDKFEEARQEAQHPATGVVNFDGVQVAAWFVPWLLRIRGRGRWGGSVVSGWRDPEYSEQLCYRMCGAPTCPGRCAGRLSNHAGSIYPAGAIDVSDYYVFAAEARAVNAPFFNALGAQDPVHFSTTGR